MFWSSVENSHEFKATLRYFYNLAPNKITQLEYYSIFYLKTAKITTS